ncbi:MAG: methionyl-tRNA formyltransferase, partial [Dehalococcoidia bacterium]
CQRAGIPMISIRDPRHPDAIETIAALRPAMIAVACYPWRLPRAILDLPLLGCLNVHPSLLPVGRGPEPIFWTFRRGERETGTTIHLMDERFDAGLILLQERIAVPGGARARDIERQLATIGGRLLVEAIDRVVAGSARSFPQDDTLTTAAPYPTNDDYVVATDRPARWAFNFVRGVAPHGGPLRLHVVATGEQFPLLDALDCTENGRLDVPALRHGNILTVQFHPGTARFILHT